MNKKGSKAGYDVDMIPYELRYSLNEAEELLDDLQNKNQRMFKLTMLIYTYADSLDELNKNVYQIVSAGRKKKLQDFYIRLSTGRRIKFYLPYR